MKHRLQGRGMTSPRTRDRMIERLLEQGISKNSVLEIMRQTPRHIFIPEPFTDRAYEDTALPIGENQTISQPYIVARMTELLISEFRPTKVLEIGTGCGYQTAILAQLIDQVYSVERILPLHRKAKRNLYDMRLNNVSLKHSDGGWGWQEHAFYDAIMVTAAPPEIPEILAEQLAIGGIMIIPVGRQSGQVLHKVTRTPVGFDVQELEPVSFVPFLAGKIDNV